MAERIYNFCKKYHEKTQVMVSGIRKPAGKSPVLLSVPLLSDALALYIGATLRSGMCLEVLVDRQMQLYHNKRTGFPGRR